MQKIFFILCCALVLLCSTSCEEHMDIEHCPISQDVNVPNPKIEKFIQQARLGEIEAYDALAVCYCNGDGVKQSVFNMMTMYALSCKKSGKNVKDIIKSLDENHLLRLLIDMLDHARVKDIPQKTVAKLRNVSPADAMIYDAIYAFECKNDTLASQQLLKEAAAKGSDIACILQIFLYEELDNQELYEQSLHKYADRFPVLYVKLGELSMRDDSEGHWEQAVKYYTLADNNGMLTEEGALALSSVYRMLEKEGKMKCDPKEMVRLEALANHKWK